MEVNVRSYHFILYSLSLIISQRYILPSVSLSFILCVWGWDEVHIRKFFWARNILQKSHLCRQCWLLSVTVYGRQQNTQFICFLFKKNVKLYFCFFADWILIIVFNANTWKPPPPPIVLPLFRLNIFSVLVCYTLHRQTAEHHFSSMCPEVN